jgi:DNA-binding transcriptional LysR family regulator
MSVHVKVFVALLVVGTVGILGYRFALPLLRDAEQRQTSDAAATRGRISIGVDNWIGYFPLCSPEMSRRMRGEGWALRCDDDGADYAARMKKLAAGEIDFAVASLDAFVLNGAPLDFPGTIVAVIDESKGGDAIVARRAAIASLDALKARPDTRIAFTPASPSEHLLKSIATHFDLPQLRDRRGRWRVEADGSTDALAKLRAGEADVAVLWEPDVSRALASDEFIKLIGTGDTDKLIVDVLIASRKVVQDRPEVVATLLAQYFQALRFYGEQPGRLSDDVRAWSGLDAAQVEAMLAGVRFATLNDNGALWFAKGSWRPSTVPSTCCARPAISTPIRCRTRTPTGSPTGSSSPSFIWPRTVARQPPPARRRSRADSPHWTMRAGRAWPRSARSSSNPSGSSVAPPPSTMPRAPRSPRSPSGSDTTPTTVCW